MTCFTCSARSSRLALTWADEGFFRSCPQVKRGQPTRRGCHTQLRGTSPRFCLTIAVIAGHRPGRYAEVRQKSGVWAMSVIIKGKNPRKPHTVRYWVDGRQCERSFATAREAQDFKIKTDHDTRAQILDRKSAV